MTINRPQGGTALSNGPGSSGDRESSVPSVLDRRLPPVVELAVASVMMMLAGGVYLASYLPRHPRLGPAVILLSIGALLTVISVLLLSRIKPFAWKAFFTVFRWALLAYIVIAGILGFVFIYDHTRGTTLEVLLLTLVVFAVDVPMIIAFTVARYDTSG